MFMFACLVLATVLLSILVQTPPDTLDQIRQSEGSTSTREVFVGDETQAGPASTDSVVATTSASEVSVAEDIASETSFTEDEEATRLAMEAIDRIYGGGGKD